MYRFHDSSPRTPAHWAMTDRGGLYDQLGDQVGFYLSYPARPGHPHYRNSPYVLAAIYDRVSPGTGTGGHCNYRASTWTSVAQAKAWMRLQVTMHSTLV